MRTTREIKQQLEQSGAMMKSVYARDELLPGYKAFEEAVLRTLFNERYSDALRMYDARDHLRSACAQYALTDSEVFNRLDYTLTKFSKTTSALINGERGEQAMRRALESLRCKYVTVYNVETKHGDDRIECDAVVITPWGVIIAEAKWYKHDVIIDEDGFVHERFAPQSFIYNVGEKLRTKEHVLWQRLEEAVPGLLLYDRVRAVLVPANNAASCDNRFDGVEVCRCGKLPYAIEKLQDDACLSDEQVDRIAEIVRGISCSYTYPSEIDFDQLRCDLAETISAIERASERREREEHLGIVVASGGLTTEPNNQSGLVSRENRKFSYEYVPAWGWFGAGMGVGSAIAGAIALLARRNAA